MTPADVWGICHPCCVSSSEPLPGSASSDLTRSTASHTEPRQSFSDLQPPHFVAPLLEAPECLTHSDGEAQTTKAGVVACSSCKRLKNQLPTRQQMTVVLPANGSRATARINENMKNTTRHSRSLTCHTFLPIPQLELKSGWLYKTIMVFFYWN